VEISTLKGHTQAVTSIAFDPFDGGKTLASSSFDKTVKVWELSRWVEMPNR
jgi:WD40 repeat protein